MKYVAYYRVSTREQGDSGLGLEAQREQVRRAVMDGEIVSEHTEIESGKKNDRPILMAAMEECRREGHMLVIAKLDRLSRSATFISRLLDSEVPFLCADVPSMTPLVMRILGAVAQEEREVISKRTKAAMDQKRLRGDELGNAKNLGGERARLANIAAHKKRRESNPDLKKAIDHARSLRDGGSTLQQIAERMNSVGYTSPRGKSLTATQIKRMLAQ